MSESSEVIDGQLAAYRRRDLDGFLSFYRPEILIRDFAGDVRMRGLEEMRAMYGTLFSDSPNLAVEIANRIDIGTYVIDEEHISGFMLAGFPAEFVAAVAYRIEGDAIMGVALLA
jgi:hypothetical protein